MTYLIFISVAVSGTLLFLLSSNSANTEGFSIDYYSLLGLTGVLASGLLALVGYQLWRLRKKLKNKVFGAKLTLRLMLFFTLIGVLPGVLIYAVSVQFLDKSIESWFDVRVEKALEGGLNLGRSGLDNSLKELAKKAEFTASLLAEKHAGQYQRAMDQLVDTDVAQQAALFTAKGKLIASSPRDNARAPDKPDSDLLRLAMEKGEYAVIDTLPDKGLTLLALAKVNSGLAKGGGYVLQFTQPVPKQIEADAETVQSVYRDYQELTLSLLLVLLTAVSAAFFFSDRFGSSLEALAEGTRAVAQGDFTEQYPIRSSDELGALTGLFNQMTRQLFEAKQSSEQQQRVVEGAKVHLESVLTHLSSGVLALDHEMRLRSVNTSAAQILSAPLQDMQRMSISQIAERYNLLKSFCQTVVDAFGETDSGEWERQIERLSRNGTQILLMRGTRLPEGGEAGYVVVFDDISHLLQAERQAAWGEVARRLAHEIKNPLTPIQLSAERLQHKLSDKLDEGDAQLLRRATQTIVSQVGAMKNMVSDFANYARGPALKLSHLDVHKLIMEVLGLYETSVIHIVLKLEAPQSVVNGDATRLRQVIHNLLQNAQDAVHDVAQPQITLHTRTDDGEIHLWVEDNGAGFPASVLTRAFEPYMTTKAKGTGLGLAVVKKIMDEHGGRVTLSNRVENGVVIGAQVSLSFAVVN